ncbi:MAG: hypothetical protein HZB39_08245 [Planctomycetes bacterium]|nr:hypothetical protein [Planctomycetota bacterium]
MRRSLTKLPCTTTTLALVLLTACGTVPAQDPPELAMPPRGNAAVTGSALLSSLRGLALADREVLLAHEFAAGNVPSFLRKLVPVTTQATIGGRTRTATFWCTPDYLGFGTDADWFRMPMTPTLAQSIADRLDCVMPTRRMVDAIWAAAPVKLAPFPYSPSIYDILSVDLFHQHHLQIESQRGARAQALLVAGIKKDVVASALIADWPDRVVIYGWHYQNGTPIQPLWKGHTFLHVDYSHGIRLVARRMTVDGVTTTVDAVLADPSLQVLLSDEGPFASWRYPAIASESFPLHDTFPVNGPQLVSWRSKFTAPVSVATSPPPPSGDATALRIMDPAGGTESLRITTGLARDAGVQADLLCEFRPELAANGFERIGVFVRDRASGAFDGTLSQQGACYALTWDSHDGRVRCLRCNAGVLTDLLPAPRFVPGTAWRRFRVEAAGDRLAFFLDGERLLETSDATHAQGAFGIGFHEYFATNANMRGARADSFHADVPGAFTFVMRPGLGIGGLELRRSRGVPGDWYFTALTVVPGSFPNGWFFGLDPTHDALGAFLGSGHPAFVGALDASGSQLFATSGLPPGIPLQGVSVELDPSVRLLSPSRAVAMTTR